MIVTPGIELNDTEDITAEKLNQLGAPVVEMEDADVDNVLTKVQAALGAGVTGRNYFLNPGLNKWTRGPGPIALSEGVRERGPDAWWARCNSATSLGSGGTFLPTCSRVTSAHHQQWIYAAEIRGNTGVGAVDFGQDLAAHVAAALHDKLTVSFDLYNATGAALTPQVRLDTCDSFEQYGAVTNVASGNGQSIPHNTLGTVTVTLDTGAFGTALRRGAALYIRIPTNALNGNTKYVEITALKVEASGKATTRYQERDDTPQNQVSSGGGTGALPWLQNGDFSVWPTMSPVTCTAAVDSYAAAGWAARPAIGSDLVYSLTNNVPPGAAVVASAQLTGGTGTTGAVDFVQNIPPEIAAGMQRLGVFSVYLYNNTGIDFAPSLRLHTCDAWANFSATTSRATSSGQTCANGAWTRLTLAFNGATATNIANGVRLIIRIPDGMLDNNSKVIRIAQAQLEPGVDATEYLPRPDLGTVGTLTRNLYVVGTTSGIAARADEVIMIEPGGRAVRLLNASLGVTPSTSGAGGLDTGSMSVGLSIYYLWLISNGETCAAIISLSSTDPVMPTGYRYKARIGAFSANATGITPFVQTGPIVSLQTTSIWNGNVSVADVYQGITLAPYVPPIAGTMAIEVRLETNANLRAGIKSTIGFAVAEQLLVGSSSGGAVSGVWATDRVSVPVPRSPSAFEVQFKASATGSDYRLMLLGYTLP